MPVFSSEEWHVKGTDEPDVRDTAAVSPAGIASPPPPAPARPAAALAEPPWIDPPFNIWQPTIDGNLTVFDDGTSQWGQITCRMLNAQTVNAPGITDWVNVRQVGAKGDGITDDTAAFQAAVNRAPTGSVVYLPAGSYLLSSTVTVPPQVSLLGSGPGTVISYTGSGACLSQHGSNASFTPTFRTNGFLRDFTIDGSNAAAGAIGLDIGDGWGINVDITIRHFNGAGSIGLYLVNRSIWSEKCRFVASVQDCTNLVVVDVQGGLPSHVYSDYQFYLFANANQNGIVLNNGAELSSSTIFVRGNFQTSNSALTNSALSIANDGSTAHIHYSLIHFAVENDGGLTNSPQPIIIGANGYLQECTGLLSFLSTGGTNWAASTLNGGWNFKGLINGDATLRAVTTPAVPASGTVLTNNGNDAFVSIRGGTVTDISLGQGGVATTSTGQTGGMFFLGTNQSIKLTYSAAPTWTWFTAVTF